MKKNILIPAVLLFLLALPVPLLASTVLTSLPAVHSITSELTQGTSIDVINVCDTRMDSQKNWIRKNEKAFAALAEKADAAITIRGVWRADPLYPYARKHNVRIVEIDPTTPLDSSRSTVQSTGSGHVWLSTTNALIMAQNTAFDLERLFPADKKTIEKNLGRLSKRLARIRIDTEIALSCMENTDVFCLTDEFAQLTGEFNLHTAGRMTRDDYYWTPRDMKNLETTLRNENIHVVIHKWTPDKKIRDAIEGSGARLVVLDPIDRGDHDYIADMQKNINELVRAFEESGSKP